MQDPYRGQRRERLHGRKHSRVSMVNMSIRLTHTVVLCPPGKVASTDDILEYETDNAPSDIVDS